MQHAAQFKLSSQVRVVAPILGSLIRLLGVVIATAWEEETWKYLVQFRDELAAWETYEAWYREDLLVAVDCTCNNPDECRCGLANG